MKPSKWSAGIAAGALVLGGVVGIALATVASAAPPGNFDQTVHLYGQVNNNNLSGNQDLTTRDINLTVSPASAAVGSPITVTVSSTNLILCNGPAAAAAAYGEELDAIISFNGQDYVLQGPQNTTSVPASTYLPAPACNRSIFDAGWTVSSSPGGSTATTNSNASTATTGLGTGTWNRVNGSISGAGALTAPGTAGTYPIALEALSLNSTGTTPPYIGQGNLYDDFDQFINTDSTSACFNSATCGGTAGPGGSNDVLGNNPGNGAGAGSVQKNITADYITPTSAGVALTAVGPQASATAQNLGGTNIWTNSTSPAPLALGSGGVPYVHQNDVLNITGNANWGATNGSSAAASSGIFQSNNTNMAISLCPASSTAPFDTTQGCAPAVVAWGTPSPSGTTGSGGAAGLLSTTGGQLNPFSIELTTGESGNWNYWIIKCDNPSTTTGSGLSTTDQKSCVYSPTNKIASGGTGCTYNAAGASGASIPDGTPCPTVTGYGPTQVSKVPVYFLGTRSITTPASVVSTGSNFPVSGANWYPGETVSIKGGKPGATYAGLNVTNSSIGCSNGTPTDTFTTNVPPPFGAGSYVSVNGTTRYAGAGNGSNFKVGSVTGTNIISLTKTQNASPATTGGTFTLGLTINGTSFTVGPEQYNVASAQLQTDIGAASVAAGVTPGATYAVSSGAATAARTITVTQASGVPAVAVTGTNVTTGYTPTNVASSLSVGATNTFAVTPNYSSCTSNGTVAGGGADTSTSIVSNPGTQSGTDTGTTLTASSTGTISGTTQIQDLTDTELYATGVQTNGGSPAPQAGPAQNYAEGGSFSVSASACVAVSGNHSSFTNGAVNIGSNAPDIPGAGGALAPGNGFCVTQQTINATVTGGTLSQSATQTGSNPSATTVNLGSTSTSVGGSTLSAPMNTIAVSDSRGGTFGWSLSATAPNFTGTAGHTISNAALSISPACVVDPGYTALSATGESAGAPAQTFAGTVNLCTKNNTTNATTQSTGGVYDISGTLSLAVPAFQAADVYSTVMTVTLT